MVGSPQIKLDSQGRLYGIDRYPIVLTSPEAISSPHVPSWWMDKADWDLFCSLWKVECNIEEFQDVEEAVAYLSYLLLWSSEQSIPLTSGITSDF